MIDDFDLIDWHEPTPTPRTLKRTVAFLVAILITAVVAGGVLCLK